MDLQNKLFKNDEYPPSEDTFFLVDYIEKISGQNALDIGSGSGYITKLLWENFAFVVGTDINLPVLQNQSSYKTRNLVCCSGSDALLANFDLIVCNLPYLATDEIIDIATDGGKDGFEIPKIIFDSVKLVMSEKTRFVFVTSSLSDFQKLADYWIDLGYDAKIVSKKKLFFEELILIEVSGKNN